MVIISVFKDGKNLKAAVIVNYSHILQLLVIIGSLADLLLFGASRSISIGKCIYCINRYFPSLAAKVLISMMQFCFRTGFF